MVKLLSYSERAVNIGDALQTIALKDFLQSRGITVDGYVDRKNMKNECSDLIVNGWNRRTTEPLPSYDAKFIGIHTDKNQLLNIKKDSLIGCRDSYTLSQLNKIEGYKGFLSCCATNTLPVYEGPRKGIVKLFYKDYPHDYNKVREGIDDGPFDCLINADWETQMKHAYDLIDYLKTKELVYTDRLHIVLPCISLGTPVILTPRKFQKERYSIFETFKEYPGEGKVIDPLCGLREKMRDCFIEAFEQIFK